MPLYPTEQWSEHELDLRDSYNSKADTHIFGQDLEIDFFLMSAK